MGAQPSPRTPPDPTYGQTEASVLDRFQNRQEQYGGSVTSGPGDLEGLDRSLMEAARNGEGDGSGEEPLEWNNSTLIKDNIVEEITNLKQQDGKDITVHGSATLVQTLMQHGLVDRYRLLVYPVVVGKGKRLFEEGIPATLKLVESQSFSSGVVALVYEPDRQ